MFAELDQKGEMETPAESEKERHGPAGPRREGDRVNANA